MDVNLKKGEGQTKQRFELRENGPVLVGVDYTTALSVKKEPIKQRKTLGNIAFFLDGTPVEILESNLSG